MVGRWFDGGLMLHGFSPGIVSQGASAYLLEQSLLGDGTSSYLNRTPSVAGNRKTWTFSCWFKGTPVSSSFLSVEANDANGPQTDIAFQGGGDANKFEIYGYSSGYDFRLLTSSLYRDSSAWYHIVVAMDTTQATAANRTKIYINGTQVTSFGTSDYPTLNYDTGINALKEHFIMKGPGAGGWVNGAVALPQLIDGAALSATDFGETDTDGFWNPIEFTGEYNIAGSTPTVLSSSAIWTGGTGWTFTSDDISGVAGDSAVRTLDYAFSDDFSVEWTHRTTASSSYTFGVYPTASDASFNNSAYAAGVFYSTGLTTSFSIRLDSPTTFSLWGGTSAEQSSIAIADNDVLKFERVGDTFKVYKNAALVRTMTFTNTSQMRIALGKGNVANLEAVSFDYEIVAGTNGGAYDFADDTWFGKNISGTDDQAALSSATIGTSNWLDIPAAFTAGSGTLSRTSTAHSARSSNVLTGDFSITMNLTAGMAGFRCGVYAAAEDGTWKFADADAMGDATAMTDSYFLNMGAANFQKGSATFGSTTQAAGTCTVVRVGSTITITAVNGTQSYAFTSAYTGPMRFMVGGGGVAITLTTLSWTADGQAGTSYFDTGFATTDQLADVPTNDADNDKGNFCTLNPNDRNNTSLVLTEGNTYLTASGDGGIKGTIFVDSGEHHFEYVPVSTTTNNMSVGVTLATSSLTNETPTTGDYAFNIRNGTEGGRAYDIFSNGTTIATGSLPAAPNGENIGVVFDADAGTLKFYNANLAASGDLIYTISSIPAGAYTVLARSSNNTHIFDFNFGQRPFVDSNLNNANAIATQNLPEATIPDGSKHMNTVLYTGNGTAIGSGGNAITGVGFQPDFVWLKVRSLAFSHQLYDGVRGATNRVWCDLTNAETPNTETLTSFDIDGFTLGSNTGANTAAETYVAWCWKASTAAGFEIVSYVGNGTTKAVAHTLGVDPEFVIVKSRDSVLGWPVWHTGYGKDRATYLNTTAAEAIDTQYWNNGGSWSSSQIVLGNRTDVNTNLDNYIAYIWAGVEGFSKFGSYTGNASTDGPFVYTGFRPSFVMTKNASATSNWNILDTERSTYNPVTNRLAAQSSNAEDTARTVDFLSNGFKIRESGSDLNGSGNTIIYAAFAEQPFQGGGGVTQARAR